VGFRLTPLAEADIEAILLHIAKDSRPAAIRWYDVILQRCERLGEMSGIGVSRDDIRPALRTFFVGRSLILYRAIDADAEIVRVVHGARQWQDLL
jgi:toxin ParE1/3/4